MGFNRDVIRRRRDQLNEMGVRVRWVGRRPQAVGQRHRRARAGRGADGLELDVLTLAMCVNYGGRAEIADAAADRRDVHVGRLRPEDVDEQMLVRYLDEPDMPDVDLFVRSLGRAAHVELPAVAVGLRRAGLPRHAVAGLRPASTCGEACEIYADRDRRYGGAVPNEAAQPPSEQPPSE